MNDGLGKDDELRDKIRQMTSDKKRELLASDSLSTARAQVTFALPPWCREILGDTLQPQPAEPAMAKEENDQSVL